MRQILNLQKATNGWVIQVHDNHGDKHFVCQTWEDVERVIKDACFWRDGRQKW